MSDSDDWDKSDNEEDEKKKEEEKKKKKQQEEDEEEKAAKAKKEKEAKAKEDARIAQENARVKENKKIDYDKKFKERQAAMGVVTQSTGKTGDGGSLTKAEQEDLSKAAEQNLSNQLFGADEESKGLPAKVDLNTEKQYKEFGTKIGDILYAGSAPYRIENFFRELCKKLPDNCDATQIQKIADHLKIIHQAKQKAEKDAKKTKKKAPTLKGGGNKEDFASMNMQMGAALLDDDDMGNDHSTFKREEEEDYDFM